MPAISFDSQGLGFPEYGKKYVDKRPQNEMIQGKF
jgi:hypothetical protein